MPPWAVLALQSAAQPMRRGFPPIGNMGRLLVSTDSRAHPEAEKLAILITVVTSSIEHILLWFQHQSALYKFASFDKGFYIIKTPNDVILK